MLGNQDLHSASGLGIFVVTAASRSNSNIWKANVSLIWGSVFLLYLSIAALNCLETFWVKQIKKLEENNHRFASALASASFFLTRLLSLLFIIYVQATGTLGTPAIGSFNSNETKLLQRGWLSCFLLFICFFLWRKMANTQLQKILKRHRIPDITVFKHTGNSSCCLNIQTTRRAAELKRYWRLQAR